ncbi:polysaccharide deacetylase family protein [Lysinibacillus sp. MHQ-1]|nr:polysaccharide deacetylase family protein [Lysinibacillus sp. MHQ-1]
MALTFDDGPHPKYTAAVLDLLAKYDAKATFFYYWKKMLTNIQSLFYVLIQKGMN